MIRQSQQAIGFNRNNKLGRLSKQTHDRLTFAQERLLLGQQFRQRSRESVWEDSYELYMTGGQVGNAEDPTADLVRVNVAFSTMSTLVPFVADEDPQFTVKPYSGDARQDNAAVLETFLNHVWKSSKMRGQTHLADTVFDFLLFGDGFLKVGYDIRQQEIFDALGNQVQNRVDVAEFKVERVNPWDVWIDPYSDGLHNARWVCHRIILPASEVREDPRYRVPKDHLFEAGEIDSRHTSAQDRRRLDDVRTDDWVTVFEFYDLKEKWSMSFTQGALVPLRYIEHVECPIVQMSNYRIPNSPYHMGEIEQISSLQHELNKSRSQMITHRRRNVAKWLVRTGLVDEEAEQAMKSSRINEIIPIEAQEPLEHLIQYVAPQSLSADSYMIDERIRDDINEITGVNEYLRGVPTPSSRTATEAQIIEGATNIRTRHKLISVERCARDAGQLLLDIMRDVLPLTDYQEMRMYITGVEAEKLNRAQGMENPNTDSVLTPNPEIFEGAYEVDVERGSTELRNPQVRAGKLREMVMMMLNATPVLMEMQVHFNIKRLLEMWFEAEGIEDVDSLFEMEEDQGMMQQMMMQQFMAGQGEAGADGGLGSTQAPSDPVSGLGEQLGFGGARTFSARPPQGMVNVGGEEPSF